MEAQASDAYRDALDAGIPGIITERMKGLTDVTIGAQ